MIVDGDWKVLTFSLKSPVHQLSMSENQPFNLAPATQDIQAFSGSIRPF
jgi:hypothetical protein